jgi:hypothetical protein
VPKGDDAEINASGSLTVLLVGGDVFDAQRKLGAAQKSKATRTPIPLIQPGVTPGASRCSAMELNCSFILGFRNQFRPTVQS